MEHDVRWLLAELAEDVSPVVKTPAVVLKRARRRRVLFVAATLLSSLAVVGAGTASLQYITGNRAAVGPVLRPAVVASIPLGGPPDDVAAIGNSVWVSACTTLMRVDADSNDVTLRMTVAGCPHQIEAGFGSIWVGTLQPSPGVLRLDPVTGQRVAHVPIATEGLFQLVMAKDALWVLKQGSEIVKIDPATNRASTVAKLRQVGSIAVGLGSVWAIVEKSIARIDPFTGQIVQMIQRDDRDGDVSGGLTIADGALWVDGDSDRYDIERIDVRSGRKVDRVDLPRDDVTPSVLVVDDAIWVGRDSDLVRYDPRSRRVTHVVPMVRDSIVWGLTTSADSIWAVLFRSEQLVRIELRQQTPK